MSVEQPSILVRSHLSAPNALTPLQSQVDGVVGGFAEQATDLKTIAAITAGSLAYRMGRVGLMGLGSGNGIRALSIVGGLGAEVSAFEMTNRTLAGAHIGAPHGENPNLWRWNGMGGLRQGLFSSLITFGALKSAGSLARGENIFVQHLLQDAAMVAGHQAAGALGAGPRPTGSLAEQFLHAEATNLQLGAGMALSHGFASGLHGLERGLDLSLRSPPNRGERPVRQPIQYFVDGSRGPLSPLRPALADGRANGSSAGQANSRPRLDSTLILMASEGGRRERDLERLEPPVTSDIRPKALSREEATSGTYSYPPVSVSTREMEARYRMVVESATDGIATVDEGGRILFINPAIRRIFGYEPADLLGKPLTLLMSPEMARHHEQGFHRYIATGERSIAWESVSLTGIHKEGREILLEISIGEFIESGQRTFTAVMRDVSERRKAEQELREVTERSEALLRAMPYKLCRVHRDGTILDVRSNQPEDLLQSPEKLIGTNVRDLPLPQALREITTTILPRALETGEMQIVEYLFPHPDGKNLFQRARILKSGPDEVVWITEDITENKREEAVRLEREKHETLLLVGQGLAHDINNALGSGMPYLNFIRDSLRPLLKTSALAEAEGAREGLEQIMEDVSVLETSMNRIRSMTTEFSEITGHPKPRTPVDLHSLIQQRNLRAYLGPGIPLTLHKELVPFRVWGHLDGLARVIENLVKNARDAMEGRPNPLLTVETRGIYLNDEALARLLPLPETEIPPGLFMRLRVEDTGLGMDKETLRQIFRPYFSTKTKDPSQPSHRGVGLAISLKLIRDLGGFITVKSKPGEGTVFDLYLPEATEDIATRSPRSPAYPPPTLPPPSLLPTGPPPPDDL